MNVHKSVLNKEAIESLEIKKNKVYIDATLNGGGHTGEILKSGGKVLGIDLDGKAIRQSSAKFGLTLHDGEKLSAEGKNITIIQGNFANLREIAKSCGVWETPGVLFDLGLSSNQLEDPERGFSFTKNGPLDMRMDTSLQVTAADLINSLSERELHELFSRYGEEHASRRIARAIVNTRIKSKIKSTRDLATLIESVVRGRGRIHPATRVFQALRIAVNSELENLKKGLNEAVSILSSGGRVVVISFHSLEDRIVKEFFKNDVRLCVINKKPIVPTEAEINLNPRSRSAKMRVAEKI